MKKDNKEAKETIDNLTETIQNVNRIRPRRSKMGHRELNNGQVPATPVDYDYEYDETEEKDDFEEE